ncbi:MAG: hypothetical protein JXQ73_31140, partial [Phycisphaerae bacterium]|nr:hypothetical protein [Phycisphaerae bacterium]
NAYWNFEPNDEWPPAEIRAGESSGVWKAIGDPNGTDGKGTYSWSAHLGTPSSTSGRTSTFQAGGTGGYGWFRCWYAYPNCKTGTSAYTSIVVVEAKDVTPDPLVIAVGSQGYAQAVTEPNVAWDDPCMVTMSADGVTTVSSDWGWIRVTSATPTEGTITATCGSSTGTGTVKVVALDANTPLSVSNATKSTWDPNHYVACWEDDDEAFVEITANLTSSLTDEQARTVLQWNIPPRDPNDPWTKRYVPLNAAGRTPVTATVGTTHASAVVFVVRISSLKVSDSAEPDTFWRQNPPDANDLYVPERKYLGLLDGGLVFANVYFAPPGAAHYVVAGYEGAYSAFIRMDPNTGSGPIGAFLFTPDDPNGRPSTYTIKAGVDRDGVDPPGGLDAGAIDCGGISVTTKVVQVDPPLAVVGAPSHPDPNEIDTYYIGHADEGQVEIVATLNPSCPDHEAWNLLHWEGTLLPDANDATTRILKRYNFGRNLVRATVGDSAAGATVDILLATVSGFSRSPTYVLGPGCADPNHVVNHETTCQATIVPSGYEIVYSIQGDHKGATIDSATGVLTPGSNDSGTVTVRAAPALWPSSGYGEANLLIKARPVEIVFTDCQQLPLEGQYCRDVYYGALYTHFFTSTGGDIQGEQISETVAITRLDFDIPYPGVPSPGQYVWPLGVNWQLLLPDHIIIQRSEVDVNDFLPDSLPAMSTSTQDLYWKCPLCNAWREIVSDIPLSTKLMEDPQNPGAYIVVTSSRGLEFTEPYTGPEPNQP